MAIIASWSGAGLTDGAPVDAGTVGTGDTPFNVVTTSTPTFSVSGSGLHAPRIQADQQTGVAAQLIWDATTLGTLGPHAVRVYVELTAYPSAGARVLAAHDAVNVLQWWLDVTAAGVLRLRDPGGTAVDVSAAPLPLGAEMRIEVVGDGTGTVTATVYAGDSATPWDVLSGAGLGTTFEQLRVGNPNVAPTWPRIWFDGIAVSDEAAEIGPIETPIPSGGGTLSATAALTGTGTKTGIGGGTLTASAAGTGTGMKTATGGGTLTATAVLTGTGQDITPPPPRPPRFPLRDRYELLLAGTWVDITSYVYERDPVPITRGRSAEAQIADPAKLTLTLNNRDGRFSHRNPVGPWYGVLGRNTPLRASLPYGSSYLRVAAGDSTSKATCPHAAGLGITGDLDIRIEVDADHWNSGDLAAKYRTSGDQRSWWLGVDGGRLLAYWSPDGTFASRRFARSSVALPAARGRLAVRMALDVDNGAGGYTVRFYTAPTISGPWTQLGTDLIGSAPTSVHAGTAGLEIGAVDDLTLEATTAHAVPGRYLAFELRDGIDGTVVAGPDFSTQTPGATAFSDGQGNTWTMSSTATLDDRLYRFHGEVASWPATWAMDGVDRYVKITASGLKRRLQQNPPSLRSTMYRAHTSPEQTDIQAYWPAEDGSDARQIASGRPGGSPMQISGAPTLADYGEWTASGPMPTMGTGRFAGTVPPYTASGEIFVYMFVLVEEPPSETSLLKVITTGSAPTWEIRVKPDGALITKAWRSTGVPIDDGAGNLDASVAFDLTTRGSVLLSLQLKQVGSDVSWTTAINEFDDREVIADSRLSTLEISGTVTGVTIGRAARVIVGDEGGLGNTKIGHIVVADDIDKWQTDIANAVRAWNGENPLARMRRLCAEEGITFHAVTMGTTGNTVMLGDQLDQSLVELLQEAADADLGILYEPRDFLGFAYRTRLSLYNQAPAVTLDYSAGQIAGDLTPVDDDRSTVNDLTVKRVDGSSVHVEQITGPLSTQDPPDGVGRYSGEVTLSLVDDDQLPDQAGWRLHLGTVDEARYPQLTVNLRSPGITDELYEKILALDVGDRIDLTGLPEGLPPDDVPLLVQGYTETLRLMEHQFTFNLAPESPWRAGIVEQDRYDTAGSSLTAPAAATDTVLTVTSLEGWTTAPADLPFDIRLGGERCTVTAVTGAGTAQTLTVTRAVNGVVKPHATGTELSLWSPTYYAL